MGTHRCNPTVIHDSISSTNFYMHLEYPSKIVTNNTPRYADSKVLM